MLTRLGALRVSDPARWEREIRSALRSGTQEQAAEKLGVSLRQLARWIAELDLGPGQGWRGEA